MKRITLLLLAVILTSCSSTPKTDSPKYVFYFIGDGMGFSAVALTQATRAAQDGKIGYAPLNFAEFPVVGYATTNAETRLVTCSAAAGTALATGSKTSIGTIGMNTDHSTDLTSVAAIAKEIGYRTGVATSVSIDHATPASFYAHAQDRGMAYLIGTWLPRTGLDFYGGAGFVEPKGKEGDQRDLYEIFADSAYTVIRGSEAVQGNRVILTQAEGKNTAQLPYAIDRAEDDLTLTQITRSATDFLYNNGTDKGFFLMVEGGAIDWCGHNQDAAAMVRETEDMAEAMDVAIEFYKAHPDETLIVVTADHETGGLALGRGDQGYETNLKLLRSQKMSKGELTTALMGTKSWDEAKAMLTEKMGFWKDEGLTEIDAAGLEKIYKTNPGLLGEAAVQKLTQLAGVGWTTGSHTGVFVPVYAIGVGSEMFRGAQDNTEIPLKIMSLIGSFDK